MEKEEKTDTIKNIIAKTLSAPGDHACRNNPQGMCPITSIISDNMMFVKNQKHLQCPHYVPFGYGGFCNLPIRKEIYDQYGV